MRICFGKGTKTYPMVFSDSYLQEREVTMTFIVWKYLRKPLLLFKMNKIIILTINAEKKKKENFKNNT